MALPEHQDHLARMQETEPLERWEHLDALDSQDEMVIPAETDSEETAATEEIPATRDQLVPPVLPVLMETLDEAHQEEQDLEEMLDLRVYQEHLATPASLAEMVTLDVTVTLDDLDTVETGETPVTPVALDFLELEEKPEHQTYKLEQQDDLDTLDEDTLEETELEVTVDSPEHLVLPVSLEISLNSDLDQ